MLLGAVDPPPSAGLGFQAIAVLLSPRLLRVDHRADIAGETLRISAATVMSTRGTISTHVPAFARGWPWVGSFVQHDVAMAGVRWECKLLLNIRVLARPGRDWRVDSTTRAPAMAEPRSASSSMGRAE